jgi:hypothetical protein
MKTLLCHELAHLKRGDHWIRVVELIPAVLFWWHPVVWLAKRQMREAEELCCDAQVVDFLPNRTRGYAHALVEALDFLAETRSAPAPAVSFNPMRCFQRRLQMILNRQTPLNTSFCGWVLIALLTASLPLAAFPSQQSPEPAPTQESGPVEAAPGPDEELDPAEIQRRANKAVETAMEALQKIDIAEVVRMSLGDVDVAAILEQSMEALEISLQSAAIEQTIERSFNNIDIEEIVEEALDASREAMADVEIRAEIERSLTKIDVSEIVEETLRAIEKANIGEAVREALEEAREAGREAKEANRKP